MNSTIRDLLLGSIHRLSFSASHQLRYIRGLEIPTAPRVGVDELALDFDDMSVNAEPLEAGGFLPVGMVGHVRALSAQLARMREGSASLWKEAALSGAPEWNEVRRLARRALDFHHAAEDDPSGEQACRGRRRYGWMWTVKPECLEEYLRMQYHPWPGVRDEYRKAGIRNYSAFQYGHTFFHCFECDDLKTTFQYMTHSDICRQYRDAIAELVVDAPETPRKGRDLLMPEVFFWP